MGIKKWLRKGNVLYYPGCLVKGVLKQELENYKFIFNKLGIDFIMLVDEVCCGLPALNAGYKKDCRKLARKNFGLFKARNIVKIITNCPSCYHTFKEVYPDLVREWDIEVEHATVAILNGLKKKKIDFSSLPEGEKDVMTYHDPCHLGRYSGIYDEPRKVIELLGGKVVEFGKNREEAFCCGGGGGVRANFPKLSKDIVTKKTFFMPKQAEKVVSPCGLCYANLKDATEKSEEFSSFVRRKLEEFGR
tara:strand:+ start:88 stop:828 length:741 start_codon:yes stop_codon:yes gene_type:complete